MNKAYKYRIYPNSEQITLLEKTFGCTRKVYNVLLAIQNLLFERGEKYLSRTAMNNYVNSVLKIELPYLKEVDKFALTNSVYDLDDAFRRFFKKQNDHPVSKAKNKCKNSYTTNTTNNNIEIMDGHIKLPKLGMVKAKIHRTAPSGWKLKSATISKTPTGKYYASVLYEYENQVPAVEPVNILGLDYSSPYLYIDSESREPDYEKPFRKYEKKLAREHRKLSVMLEANTEGYKTVGNKRYPVWKKPLEECKNIQKQKRKVAKIYEKIANCRKDTLHKLSLELAESYDAVAVEDINMQAMSQGLKLGKSTMDNGFGMFRTFLKYKLEDRGKQLIVTDKWYPSTKICSCCGNTKPVLLSEQEYVCPECGLVIDRDLNAAINIREEAKRMLAA